MIEFLKGDWEINEDSWVEMYFELTLENYA